MTLDGTRTFVVGRERPVVIDPGPDDPEHLGEILKVLHGSEPLAILLTHAHRDHAGGAVALSRATGTPIWMARGAQALPFDEGEVGHWISDREELNTDVGRVRAFATPGHCPEHLCFLWTGDATPPHGVLFVGDLFLGEGDTTLIAHPEGDVEAYLGSLEHVAALSPTALYPAHGSPIEDPVEAVARYRAHRMQRVREVEDALRRDPGASAVELARRVYGPELDPELHPAAVASVRATLRFLGRERD
jgi:hydroxyacylglutathione hydrolase